MVLVYNLGDLLGEEAPCTPRRTLGFQASEAERCHELAKVTLGPLPDNSRGLQSANLEGAPDTRGRLGGATKAAGQNLKERVRPISVAPGPAVKPSDRFPIYQFHQPRCMERWPRMKRYKVLDHIQPLTVLEAESVYLGDSFRQRDWILPKNRSAGLFA